MPRRGSSPPRRPTRRQPQGTVLTDPPYLSREDGDAQIAVNLRWYLATRCIARRSEVARPPIACVPVAARRRTAPVAARRDGIRPRSGVLRGTYGNSGRSYSGIRQVREHPVVKFSHADGSARRPSLAVWRTPCSAGSARTDYRCRRSNRFATRWCAASSSSSRGDPGQPDSRRGSLWKWSTCLTRTTPRCWPRGPIASAWRARWPTACSRISARTPGEIPLTPTDAGSIPSRSRARSSRCRSTSTLLGVWASHGDPPARPGPPARKCPIAAESSPSSIREPRSS